MTNIKKTIISIVVICGLAVSAWAIDLYSDRTRQVITKKTVNVYADWECGLLCDIKGIKVFSLPSDKIFNVQRIRHGKDFMAIKVERDDKSGWIIYDSRQVNIFKTTIEKDNAFAVRYMKQFNSGMSLDSVHKILSEKQKDVEFYNNCLKEFQYPMKDCDKGYGLVTTTKLPSFDKSLDKGDLQMYFNFDDNQVLVTSNYEIYYPAHHQ